MSTFLRYRLLVVLLSTVVSCSQQNDGVKLPDMSRNYSKRSKKPFGTFTAFNMLKEKYNTVTIETTTKNFYDNGINSNSSVKGLYVVISKLLLLSERDKNAMLQYVSNGNQLFISAEYIDENLFEELGVEVQYSSVTNLFQYKPATAGPMRFSTVALDDSSLFHKKQYGFFYYPLVANFVNTDSIAARSMGLNDNGYSNYISIVYGKGRFFFHLHPQTFSNYFLLSRNNKEYFENVFSYTADERYAVYWDDYYRTGQRSDESFSLFAVFMKYPMLKWALLLAMALMLLYIAFASKRKQRPVPVKPPNSNASVSFVETIGRLYLQKKDNYNIAQKMITYFMEHIRSKYYLNTSHLNAEFFSSLSRKSGVEEKEVKEFFELIGHLQESTELTDLQLLVLNNRMQIFFK